MMCDIRMFMFLHIFLICGNDGIVRRSGDGTLNEIEHTSNRTMFLLNVLIFSENSFVVGNNWTSLIFWFCYTFFSVSERRIRTSKKAAENRVVKINSEEFCFNFSLLKLESTVSIFHSLDNRFFEAANKVVHKTSSGGEQLIRIFLSDEHLFCEIVCHFVWIDETALVSNNCVHCTHWRIHILDTIQKLLREIIYHLPFIVSEHFPSHD